MHHEFDCAGCGRHIYQFGGPISVSCALCIALPGWQNDPELVKIFDPDMPIGGWRDDQGGSRDSDETSER
jgi:hypothetical protein